MRARLRKISCAIAVTLILGAVPACPAYADWTIEDSTNLSSYLSSINGNLEYIYYDQQSILNQLTQTTSTGASTFRMVLDEINLRLQYSVDRLTSIRNYVDQVKSKLDAINTSIGSISSNDYTSQLTGLSNLVTSIINNTATITSQMTTNNSLLGDVINDLNLIYANSATTNTKLDTVKTAVDAVTSAIQDLDLSVGDVTVNTDLTNVEASLEEIEETLLGIARQIQTVIAAIQGIATQGTPPSTNVTNQIIGNFDFDGFEDNVDDLKDTISNLVPFGAINLLSALVNILGNVAPPLDPSMQFDFYFFGQNTIEIDLSWLDDLKPTINFVMMLALMLSLATVSAKYVRNEASV